MRTLINQGGTSSKAVVKPANTKVPMTIERWGRRYRRTRNNVFTVSNEQGSCLGTYQARIPNEKCPESDGHMSRFSFSMASRLNDRGGLFSPELVELAQLGECGQIRHAIQKHLPDQMINFMLNADCVQSLGLEVDRFAVSVERLNPHHARPADFSPEAVHTQAAFPILHLLRAVIHNR